MQKTGNIEELTIVTALTHIIEQAKDSHLSDEFWNNCEPCLSFLRTKLGLSSMQIVFIAILIERDCDIECYQFATYLKITSFEMRTYVDELDDLIQKGWITVKSYSYQTDKGYQLVPKASKALINNQVFVPEEPTIPTDTDSNDTNKYGDDEETDEYPFDNDRNSTDDSYAPSLKLSFEIPKKTLYYNPAEKKQIQLMTSMLSPKKYDTVCRRLAANGMRKGLAFLLYGGPGTGKTETVLQLARQTGRNILQVDIAGLRTKWAGQSLKNIKKVFDTYRTLSKWEETTPILFFNEADGIFSKRSADVSQYCNKEENAMQNIILQEMEDFDGILIATTNLATNMDKAFERRFLFKIELKKPELEVRAKIWRSMLKKLSMSDALYLATRYDFSGGQIENVARKRIIDYAVTGHYASLQEIEDYCQSEIHAIEPKKRCRHKPVIGFAAS